MVSRENPNIQIVGELVTPSNISFLHESANSMQTKDHYLSPPFAAGHVYTASMLDTLVCQAFYNPHVITILSHIVGGCDPLLVRRFDKKMYGRWGKIRDSHLFQIAIPKKFHNKPYGALFTWLLEQEDTLALGLKRGIMKKVKRGQVRLQQLHISRITSFLFITVFGEKWPFSFSLSLPLFLPISISHTHTLSL